MPKDFVSDTADGGLLVSPASAITSDTDGSSVDLKGFNSALFVAGIATSGDAASLSSTLMIELELEESDDDGTFTDVADADLIGYVDGTNDGTWAVVDGAADDNAVYEVQYIGDKRYVRPVVNVTGTHTNGTPIAILAMRSGKNVNPV